MLKFEAVVMIADGTPDSQMDVTTIEEVSFENPVRVSIGFDPSLAPVGRVTLRKEGNEIFGAFEIFDEEALKQHRNFVGYWPAIGGTVDKRLPGLAETFITCGLKITQVALSNSPNSDDRIKSLWSVEKP